MAPIPSIARGAVLWLVATSDEIRVDHLDDPMPVVSVGPCAEQLARASTCDQVSKATGEDEPTAHCDPSSRIVSRVDPLGHMTLSYGDTHREDRR